MKRGLGEIERRLFAYAQMRGQTTLRAGELAKPLRLTAPRERNLLSRLATAGWIVRVKRGVYLVPRTLPLGGKWSPDDIQALASLMEDAKGRYQICGPSAFNRYGFDEQVPARLYAYNNRISGERRIGAVRLVLIRVADARLGDTATVTTRDGLATVYASRARALVDAVYDWARFNSLPRAYRWIEREIKAGRVTPAELVRLTVRYGDVGTIRRMGVLLERLRVAPRLLRALAAQLSPSSGLIAWIPTAPKRGRIDRRWGVVVNGAG